MAAWAPPDIAKADCDPKLRPQAPLPPGGIGRAYAIYEIAWALAVLHDCDDYEPFVPYGEEDDWWAWTAAKERVMQPGRPVSTVLASDDWLLPLETLRERLLVELAAATDAGESAAANDAALSERKRRILEAMLELGAVDSLTKKTAQEIAIRSEGPMANENALKRLMSELRRDGFTASRIGSDGGAWLTDKGIHAAERVRTIP